MTYVRVIPLLGMLGGYELHEKPGGRFAFYREGVEQRVLSQFEDEFVRSALAWRYEKLEDALIDVMRLCVKEYLPQSIEAREAISRARDLLWAGPGLHGITTGAEHFDHAEVAYVLNSAIKKIDAALGCTCDDALGQFCVKCHPLGLRMDECAKTTSGKR